MGNILKLLPLQGALLNALIPRALPWARRGCPFRAQGDQMGVETTFNFYSNQYCMREASRVSRSWMDF